MLNGTFIRQGRAVSYNQIDFNLWTSQNNSSRQTALALGCMLVGLVLLVGFRDFGAWTSNSAAGFGLGVLLFVLGLAGFIVSGRQKVQVDCGMRRIMISDSTRFGIKKRIILFDEIVDVRIGYLGKRSNFVGYYYLILTLKNGESYPLFAPGRFFKGASDKAIVMEWKLRLEAFLNR